MKIKTKVRNKKHALSIKKPRGGFYPTVTEVELKVFPQFKAYFGYCLYKSAMRFRAAMDTALVQVKMLTPQLGILRLIAEIGPQSQQDIGDMLGIDKTSMVKFIDGLQNQKMVTRKAHSQDRRIKMIEITSKGRKMLELAATLRNKVETEFLAPLSEKECRMLKLIMPKLLRQ